MSRRPAAVAAVAAVLLALGGPAAAGPLAGPTPDPSSTPGAADDGRSAAADETDDGVVAVHLDQVGPAVVDPAAAVVVRGTLTNGGEDPLPVGTEVSLRVQRSQLSTRDSVRAWTDLDLDGAVGSLVARVDLAAEVPPGGRMPVEFSVPAAELGLDRDPDGWGPRGLSVLVRLSDGTRLGVARSHLVWWPAAAELSPTQVTVLLPLTAGAPDPTTGTVPTDRFDDLTADGAPLDAVLDAAASRGAVLALDPALLTAAGTTATAAAWSARLRSQLAEGVATGTAEAPVLLPWGDADVTALAHAGTTDLLRAAGDLARDTAQRELGSAVRTDVVWPHDGAADPAALGTLRDLGWTSSVLAESAVPAVRTPSDTPTGRTDVELPDGAGTTTALVADGELSRELADVAGDSPAAAVRALLAETAAVTLEDPRGPRHLLVAAPRDWAPGGAAATAAVGALTGVPWSSGTDLQSLLDAPAADVAREAPSASSSGELDADDLVDVRDGLAEVDRLSTALADPVTATDAATRTAVALTSGGWRDDLPGWQVGLEAFAASREALRGGVRVVPGSPVTQVSQEVQLPVTVQNTLDEDVTVVLGVRSTSSRLVITRDVEVAVPAGTTQTAYVPVRGVGSGQAVVVSQLRAPSGAVFDRPVETRVTVRADWESRTVLVLAVVAGLVLVGGLTRAVLRGRRPRGRDPLAEDAS